MTKIHGREQVIDAAFRLVLSKGLHDLRVEDIAAELGVLPSSLYYHVTNKQELLFLVRMRMIKTLMDDLERIEVSNYPAQTKLVDFIGAHLSHYQRYLFDFSLLFNESFFETLAADHRLRIRDQHSRYVDILRAIIEHGMVSGQFRDDIAIDAAVMGIWGMCISVVSWYKSGEMVSIEQASSTFATMIVDGLKKPAR